MAALMVVLFSVVYHSINSLMVARTSGKQFKGLSVFTEIEFCKNETCSINNHNHITRQLQACHWESINLFKILKVYKRKVGYNDDIFLKITNCFLLIFIRNTNLPYVFKFLSLIPLFILNYFNRFL